MLSLIDVSYTVLGGLSQKSSLPIKTPLRIIFLLYKPPLLLPWAFFSFFNLDLPFGPRGI